MPFNLKYKLIPSLSLVSNRHKRHCAELLSCWDAALTNRHNVFLFQNNNSVNIELSMANLGECHNLCDSPRGYYIFVGLLVGVSRCLWPKTFAYSSLVCYISEDAPHRIYSRIMIWIGVHVWYLHLMSQNLFALGHHSMLQEGVLDDILVFMIVLHATTCVIYHEVTINSGSSSLGVFMCYWRIFITNSINTILPSHRKNHKDNVH